MNNTKKLIGNEMYNNLLNLFTKGKLKKVIDILRENGYNSEDWKYIDEREEITQQHIKNKTKWDDEEYLKYDELIYGCGNIAINILHTIYKFK